MLQVCCGWMSLPILYTWNPNDLYFWRSTPHKTRPFPIKTKVQFGFQVPGMYISDGFQPASFSTTKGHVKSQSMITIVRHRWQTWSFGFLGDAGKHEKSPRNLRYLKWRNPHLYKRYGYCLCKGNTSPQNMFCKSYKVQYLHFRYLKFSVSKMLGTIVATLLGGSPQLVNSL